MSEATIPCPMCGAKPIIDGKSDDVRVRCEGCGVQGPPSFFNGENDDEIEKAEAEAIAAWNRRPAAAGVTADQPINHAEALELATLKQGDSNLARCYLDVLARVLPVPAAAGAGVGVTDAQPAPALTDDQIDDVTDKQWGARSNPAFYTAHRAFARALLALQPSPAGYDGVTTHPEFGRQAPDNEELENLWNTTHVGHPADFGADVLERWGGWPSGLLGYGGALEDALRILEERKRTYQPAQPVPQAEGMEGDAWLEKAEQIAFQWSHAAYCKGLGRPFGDLDRIRKDLRAHLSKRITPSLATQQAYKDSTPQLHVGGSSFEGWYSERDWDGRYSAGHIKQDMRDAYAAGMGDPLVTAATQPMPQPFAAALNNPACTRLAEWAAIGPVQRAAVEHFADLIAAEPSREARQEPAAWMHEVKEPDRSNVSMLSRYAESPWAHWLDSYKARCEFKTTALYANPLKTPTDTLKGERRD